MKDLTQFENQTFLNIETRRKDGSTVATPVWFIKDGESLLIRTIDGSGKVKRVKNHPTVRVMPCGAQGEVLGTWQEGTATVDGSEAYGRMRQMLEAKYGENVGQFEARTHAGGNTYTVIKVTLV